MASFAQLKHQHYRIILADPPWENYTKLMELPMEMIVADDAVLFLWIVDEMVPEAVRLIRAWDFDLKSVAFVWVHMTPEGIPTGRAQQCWLATRGRGYKRRDRGVEHLARSYVRSQTRRERAADRALGW